MPDLTPERLREIEARCEAATAPPWCRCSASDGHCSCHLIWSRSADGVVCKFYSHKDDDCGEGFTEEQAERNANFIEHSRDDVPDLLAALKQATEERDQFAAALELARNTLDFVANGEWSHRNHGPQMADDALLKLADPAECLKARDVEIRQKACVEAIVVARETAGPKARVIQALHDHFARDLPEYEEIQELLRKVAAPTQERADSEEGKR